MFSEIRPLDKTLFSAGTNGSVGYCQTCAINGDENVVAVFMARDYGGQWHSLCRGHTVRVLLNWENAGTHAVASPGYYGA